MARTYCWKRSHPIPWASVSLFLGCCAMLQKVQGLPPMTKSKPLYSVKSALNTSPLCSIIGKLCLLTSIAFLSISYATYLLSLDVMSMPADFIASIPHDIPSNKLNTFISISSILMITECVYIVSPPIPPSPLTTQIPETLYAALLPYHILPSFYDIISPTL